MLFKPVADYLHRQIYAKYSRTAFYQNYPYFLHNIVNKLLFTLGIFVKGYSAYFIAAQIEKLFKYTYFKGNSPSIMGDYLMNKSHPLTPPFYEPNPNNHRVG